MLRIHKQRSQKNVYNNPEEILAQKVFRVQGEFLFEIKTHQQFSTINIFFLNVHVS